ncbi:hypothetical protein [Draconibacterium halophilum]|uniref:Effector-binding domain-containing protein n=1 Tax=Draconibacterium halophilum TaxID=2706887 RepID=A0A6C0RAQ0_9BACT|nr:hypothetical protein [Draconibacterium halophilum]QIA07698.1 hypothetical protein G0Q07_08145 [Draconibacterium halophilum]
MKRRKLYISIPILFLIFTAALWYFFLKKWDYKVMFTAPVNSSVAYSFIQNHNEWDGKTLKAGQLIIKDEEPWKQLASELQLNDEKWDFNWFLKQKNDSVTKVVVQCSQPNRKMKNRFDILLQRSIFSKSVKKNIKIIRDKMIERSNEFSYTFKDYNSINEIACIAISTQSTIRGKADEMIRNVLDLNMFVKDNELGLNGDPMLVIHHWDPSTNVINFEFCFPVMHPERIPDHPNIKLKKVVVSKAIYAEYFGNYCYSDYSWGALYKKLKKEEGDEPTGRIIEVFYNDPHSGGDDKTWKAGIYMELRK